MPAKKSATKRKSEPIVEDDKTPKKIKGKLLLKEKEKRIV